MFGFCSQTATQFLLAMKLLSVSPLNLTLAFYHFKIARLDSYIWNSIKSMQVSKEE